MHVTIETVRQERDGQAADRARELASEVFNGRGGLRYSDVIPAIKKALGVSDNTADRRFSEMRKAGAISKTVANLWILAR